MKLVNHLPFVTGILIVLVAMSLEVRGQSGTTQGTRSRNDPVQREMERKLERVMIETSLRRSSSRGAERYEPLALEQIREDFLRIQVVDRRLMHSLAMSELPDLKLVTKSTSEVKKRAVRLKKNLALPEPDARAAEESSAEIQVEPGGLRSSLLTLSSLIDQFVTNPVFKESKLIDAELSAKALQDIEKIIELSGQLESSSKKLKQARPQGAAATFESKMIPAFPGAEGFGATTPGGRGGRVIFVTNVDDDGPGSFRAACEAEGPRTVIFRVSGLITLAQPIVIKNPYITIAGQTAPGDGVCLRNYTFVIATHDVIVRYLRCRLGDVSAQEADSITLAAGAHNVVLDHCSATWSIDEALSLAGNVSNVTVQWCLIAEGLNHSKHFKGAHGYGSLSRANGPVTWHHNLWAHNDSRNPRLGDNYGRAPYPTFDVRNNVIYDYGEIASGLTQGVLKVNYVANYIRPGPSSKATTPIHLGGPSDLSFYIRENVFEGNNALTADNSQFFEPVMIGGKRQVQTVAEPFSAQPVKTTSAQRAYETVLRSVGASLPRRDAVDARIVDEVRQRKGSIIDSQEQVGGWPELKSNVAPVDSDEDGMPDSWERKHGLNPHDSADGVSDKNKDGYTNLEEYLSSIGPSR